MSRRRKRFQERGSTLPPRVALTPINGCAPAALINEVLAMESAIIDLAFRHRKYMEWSEEVTDRLNKVIAQMNAIVNLLNLRRQEGEIDEKAPSVPVESTSQVQATITPEEPEFSTDAPYDPVAADDDEGQIDWGTEDEPDE